MAKAGSGRSKPGTSLKSAEAIAAALNRRPIATGLLSSISRLAA